MRRIRRVTAIVVQLLMIQFLVVGGAAACPLAGDPAASATMPGAMSPDAHATHPQHAADGIARRGGDGASHSGPAHSHHHAGSDCALPCAPAGCAVVGQCAYVAVGAPSTSANLRLRAPGRPVQPADRALLSVSFAPEPPPPRA